MVEPDFGQTWYHGTPLVLEVLSTGSTITQDRELARVFSHKPTIMAVEDDGTMLHNGRQPGILYRIAEPVAPGDVVPHPRTTMAPGAEWLTTRELRLERIGETIVREGEYMSDAEFEAYIEARRSESGG